MRGRDSFLVLAWTSLLSCQYIDNPNTTNAAGEEGSGWITDTDDSTTQSDGDGSPNDGDSDDGDGDGDGDSGDGDGDGDSGDGDGDGDGGPECGNGLVEVDEECDDANLSNTDDCTNDCIGALCGDGFIHAGVEECDAGDQNGPDMACTGQCLANVCGDGNVGPGEGCDDGNDIDDDACNACALASCGDTVLNIGEECDDGDDDDGDACLSTCVIASCGDGFILVGQEECDDGDLNSDTAMCTAMCTVAVCGDGLVLDGVEACDDGNNDDLDGCANACLALPDPPTLSFSQVKQFDFEWMPVLGAEYYQLLESIDMGEPYVDVGPNLLGLETSLTVPLHFRLNASYKLRACSQNGCTDSEAVDVVGPLVEAIGYFKASNTDANDKFGGSVALSGDGNTLAVGAYLEDSNATGIDGNQVDDFFADAGAVYVFVRNGQNAWSQQAYVKASNTGAGDQFGISVALSDDGDTLAVGAALEDSSATGITGNQVDQVDNSTADAGAAYVFVRDVQNAWSQQAYVKASNTDANDHFGVSVALSGNGDTLAVGASWESSGADGIDGSQSNTATQAGAVYVFTRSDQNTWSQQAYVKSSNSSEWDYFGFSLALSGDGATLAVGAIGEESAATGIDGNQMDYNSSPWAGAAYVFVLNVQNEWEQQAYVKATNTDPQDQFGYSVALSENGNTLVVGAYREASSATGIDGNQFDNSCNDAGAAYVFVRNVQDAWLPQAYVKASNTTSSDNVGWSVALSGDGNTLAVGARREGSNAVGIGGNQANNWSDWAGGAYVFVRENQNTWSQHAYVKASNTAAGDRFGYSVALSDDGNTLAIGAVEEDSSATGISGNQADNSANEAGAIYLY